MNKLWRKKMEDKSMNAFPDVWIEAAFDYSHLKVRENEELLLFLGDIRRAFIAGVKWAKENA